MYAPEHPSDGEEQLDMNRNKLIPSHVAVLNKIYVRITRPSKSKLELCFLVILRINQSTLTLLKRPLSCVI